MISFRTRDGTIHAGMTDEMEPGHPAYMAACGFVAVTARWRKPKSRRAERRAVIVARKAVTCLACIAARKEG